MQKNNAFVILTIILLSFIASTTFACTALAPMSFEDATTHADLIILGQKVAQSPDPTPINPNPGTWIDIKINQIIKGNPQSTQIRLTSTDPCGYTYAPIPNYNEQLIMLKYNPTTTSYERVTYNATASDLFYTIENNNINYYDIYTATWKNISLSTYLTQNNFTLKLPYQPINYDLNIHPDVNLNHPLDINTQQIIQPAQQFSQNGGSTLAKLIPLSEETIIATVVVIVILVIIIGFAVTKATYRN